MKNKIYTDILGLSETNVVKVSEEKKQLTLEVEHSGVGVCHCCKQKFKYLKSSYIRTIEDFPMSGRLVYLHLRVRQGYCIHCEGFRKEYIDFVSDNQRYTKRYGAHLHHKMTYSRDWTSFGVVEDKSWQKVRKLDENYFDMPDYQRQAYADVRCLGIDEIALKKGKNSYVVVLVNLDTGQVIDLIESRKKEALIAHFQGLGASFCEQIAVFSCDLWTGYRSVSKTCFPNAKIVADRFHWNQHLLKALDQKRKDLRKLYPDHEAFKHLKYLLWKTPATLESYQNKMLQEAFKVDKELEQLYQLKNKFKAIFDAPISIANAKKVIKDWKSEVKHLNIKRFDSFLNTFQNWEKEILQVFETPYSNGIVEGINLKIKNVKRNAYGFRNFELFKRRIIIQVNS